MPIKYFDPGYFYRNHREELLPIIDQGLGEGKYLRSTNTILLFEENFSRYIGTKYAFGTASGTDSLLIIIEALGLIGKEIIILNGTFVSQIEAIIRTGNQPVLVDSNSLNFNFNLEDLKDKISDNTGAIIITHLYGIPGDIDEIKNIIGNKNIKIIEDCSHCHGGKYNEKKLGTFGDISFFSLNPTKILGGIGDGGIIVTESDSLYNKVQLISNHGRADKNLYVQVGMNSRLDVIDSFYLDYKLKFLDDIIHYRQSNARYYLDFLKEIPGISLLSEDCYLLNSLYAFPILINESSQRTDFISFMKIRGVEVNLHYGITLSEHGLYSKYSNNSLDNSVYIHSRQVSLPIGEHLSKKDLDYIVESIKLYFT